MDGGGAAYSGSSVFVSRGIIGGGKNILVVVTIASGSVITAVSSIGVPGASGVGILTITIVIATTTAASASSVLVMAISRLLVVLVARLASVLLVSASGIGSTDYRGRNPILLDSNADLSSTEVLVIEHSQRFIQSG